MNFRKFGNTGFEISALGFGAMRLPQKEADGKKVMDYDEGVRVIHRAFELGVNYIDSAPFYCDGESEIIVGRALKGWRERVKVSTKFPVEDDSTPDSMRAMLEKSLSKMDTDHVDFYHMWGIGWDTYDNTLRGKLMEAAAKLKAEGLIRHVSFSFHDKPESMFKLIDTGLFESVLCQYNLLDRSNEQAIEYAANKGLGVVIMGPVGGGRLGAPSDVIRGMGVQTQSSAETALRFVLSNQAVSCALSGMGSIAMVEENAEIASRPSALTDAEKAAVVASLEEKKKLAELYCTGCGYCMPCPQNVDIPRNFEIMNLHRVYGLTDAARGQYASLGKTQWTKENHPASDCIECGLCEEKCPQKIEIRARLKETHEALGR